MQRKAITKDFLFEGKAKVRTIIIDEQPWFVAKDLAEVLGYTDTDQAIRKHCKATRIFKPVDLTGLDGVPNRGLALIPERDMYRLIFKSKLPEAEKFEEWVVSEVLPQIRKTGSYTTSTYTQIREESKKVRSNWAQIANHHGIDAPIQFIKLTSTMKKHAGLPGNLKKDKMDELQLATIMAAESISILRMIQEHPHGYEEVKPVCQESSMIVGQTVRKSLPTPQKHIDI